MPPPTLKFGTHRGHLPWVRQGPENGWNLGISVTASDLRQKHLTAPGEGQASIPPSCALRYRVSAGSGTIGPTLGPGPLAPSVGPPGLSTAGQAWQQPSPGVCQPSRQAGLCRRPGQLAPVSLTCLRRFRAQVWPTRLPIPGTKQPLAQQDRGWSFPPGSSEKGPRGQSLGFLRVGPLSR